MLSRARQVECPYCEGSCEVFDSGRVHSRSMDPPMSKCPVCYGKGTVDEDEVDNIDTDKSLADYQQEQEWDEAEARWEASLDR